VLGSKKNSNKTATFITPMAAQSVSKLPEGDDWLYELKLDGSPYSVVVISRVATQRVAFGHSAMSPDY